MGSDAVEELNTSIVNQEDETLLPFEFAQDSRSVTLL
jgi:hypothetical protein